MQERDEATKLFSRKPRRTGLRTVGVVAFWALLAGAFVREIAPAGSAVDRMYELEAARDRFVRAAEHNTAKQALARASDGSGVVTEGTGAAEELVRRVASVAVPSVEASDTAQRADVVAGFDDGSCYCAPRG